MNARHTMVMGIAALVVLGSVETAYAQAPRAYRIEDLGSLGGSYLIGLAINSHGDVAGYGDLPDGTYHAFRWTALGGLEDLGANGGWFAQAFDINDNGDVVGVYIDANNGEHGFIAPRGGVMQDLTTWERPIRWVTSMTNDGRLAGALYTQSAAQAHAFRTRLDGTIEDLGIGDLTSVAYQMNEAGDVTGSEWRSPSVFDGVSAFRFSDAAGKVDLGTLGGLSSAGVAINSTGVVAGWSYCGNANWSCAFRASPGSPLLDLGTLGGGDGAGAESLNDAGDVVGWTTGLSGWTAFLYTDQDGMIDLNTRIPPASSGWRGLNAARAINNAGQIVLEYAVPGRNGTYRLTPSNDLEPPVVSVAASPSVLTPPDGRMIPVTVGILVTDNVDPAPACGITQVTNSEAPASGVDPDVQITGPSTVSLRASRLGDGLGRTYTITVRCADFSGNVGTAESFVNVPHDSRSQP